MQYIHYTGQRVIVTGDIHGNLEHSLFQKASLKNFFIT